MSAPDDSQVKFKMEHPAGGSWLLHIPYAV